MSIYNVQLSQKFVLGLGHPHGAHSIGTASSNATLHVQRSQLRSLSVWSVPLPPPQLFPSVRWQYSLSIPGGVDFGCRATPQGPVAGSPAAAVLLGHMQEQVSELGFLYFKAVLCLATSGVTVSLDWGLRRGHSIDFRRAKTIMHPPPSVVVLYTNNRRRKLHNQLCDRQVPVLP